MAANHGYQPLRPSTLSFRAAITHQPSTVSVEETISMSPTAFAELRQPDAAPGFGPSAAQPLTAFAAYSPSARFAHYRFSFLWSRWPLIDSNKSRGLDLWDIIIAHLIMLIAFWAPYETAFLQVRLDVVFAFNHVVDLLFAMDMVLQFFISRSDPNRPQRLIKDPTVVIRMYLRGWFLIDLLSILPVDLYFIMLPSRYDETCEGLRRCAINSLRDLSMLKLLRLLRLLRLIRFVRIKDRLETSMGISYAVLSLCQFGALVIVTCHWLACIWGLVAMQDEEEEVGWLHAVQAAKGGPDEMYESPFSIYCLAFYWALMTMTGVGYGDVTPQTMPEYIVATLAIMLTATIWAYVIGAICGIVSHLQPHQVEFRKTMDDLNTSMEQHGMPQEMRIRFRRYFHEAYDLKRHAAEKAVVAQMSPLLQGEFAMFVNREWIDKVWYLRGLGEEVIAWIARNIKMSVFSPREQIVASRALYIVKRGICALGGKVMVRGNVWGEDMLLSNERLRENKFARALSYLEVLILHIQDLFDITAMYPEARAKLRWAQVLIATCNGIRTIARKWKELAAEKKQGLTDEEKRHFVERALRRDYSDVGRRGDFLDIYPGHSDATKHATATSAGEADVAAAVDKLTQSMCDLTVQIDGIRRFQRCPELGDMALPAYAFQDIQPPSSRSRSRKPTLSRSTLNSGGYQSSPSGSIALTVYNGSPRSSRSRFFS